MIKHPAGVVSALFATLCIYGGFKCKNGAALHVALQQLNHVDLQSL